MLVDEFLPLYEISDAVATDVDADRATGVVEDARGRAEAAAGIG
jgi:hypothetical protein